MSRTTKELVKILNLENMPEIDFTKKHCEITVVRFWEDKNYIHFKNKVEQILIKLNAQQYENLSDKITDKNETDKFYREFHKKLDDHIEKMKTINYRLKLLMEKRVKILTVDLKSKDAIGPIDDKMLKLYKEKIELQKLFSTHVDAFIEDTFLWQYD